MREILFRGKRTADGEWVEGSLIHCNLADGRSYTCILESDEKMVHPTDFPYLCCESGCIDGYANPVNPETVGQFTGRVDKNGNRVFEGDIIRVVAFAPNIFVGAILWDDNDQCYLIAKETIKKILIDDFGNYGKPSYYEVIGNIHDNPELLEG